MKADFGRAIFAVALWDKLAAPGRCQITAARAMGMLGIDEGVKPPHQEKTELNIAWKTEALAPGNRFPSENRVAAVRESLR